MQITNFYMETESRMQHKTSVGFQDLTRKTIGLHQKCARMKNGTVDPLSHMSESHSLPARAAPPKKKEGTSSVLVQCGAHESGWKMPWNVTVTQDMFKTFWPTAKHHGSEETTHHLMNQ